MGFSTQQYRKKRQERPWKINPAWRGIGCILFLLIPIMSWFGASLFLQNDPKIGLPWEMTKVVAIPLTQIKDVNQFIRPINQLFQTTGLELGQLFFTVFFMFIGFGILAVVYAILYKMAGPPRYGPFDVPPNSIKRYR